MSEPKTGRSFMAEYVRYILMLSCDTTAANVENSG